MRKGIPMKVLCGLGMLLQVQVLGPAGFSCCLGLILYGLSLRNAMATKARIHLRMAASVIAAA